MAEAWSGGKGWHVEMGPRGQRGQSLGRGRLPGASQGTAAVRLGGGGAGSGLQPPWGDALSPKGKQGAESFVSKSLLGGARASS